MTTLQTVQQLTSRGQLRRVSPLRPLARSRFNVTFIFENVALSITQQPSPLIALLNRRVTSAFTPTKRRAIVRNCYHPYALLHDFPLLWRSVFLYYSSDWKHSVVNSDRHGVFHRVSGLSCGVEKTDKQSENIRVTCRTLCCSGVWTSCTTSLDWKRVKTSFCKKRLVFVKSLRWRWRQWVWGRQKETANVSMPLKLLLILWQAFPVRFEPYYVMDYVWPVGGLAYLIRKVSSLITIIIQHTDTARLSNLSVCLSVGLSIK